MCAFFICFFARFVVYFVCSNFELLLYVFRVSWSHQWKKCFDWFRTVCVRNSRIFYLICVLHAATYFIWGSLHRAHTQYFVVAFSKKDDNKNEKPKKTIRVFLSYTYRIRGSLYIIVFKLRRCWKWWRYITTKIIFHFIFSALSIPFFLKRLHPK